MLIQVTTFFLATLIYPTCHDISIAFTPCCELSDEALMSTRLNATGFSRVASSVDPTFVLFYGAVWYDSGFKATRQEIIGFSSDYTRAGMFTAGSDSYFEGNMSVNSMTTTLARGYIQPNTYFTIPPEHIPVSWNENTLRFVDQNDPATDFEFIPNPPMNEWNERRGNFTYDPIQDTFTMSTVASFISPYSSYGYEAGAWNNFVHNGILVGTVFSKIITTR